MPVELNHIIIPARDKRASAEFLGHILGVPVGDEWGRFVPVQVSNGVTLDYADAGDRSFDTRHCAFLVSEEEFDAAFGRIREGGVKFYADPRHQQPGEINHLWGGRGVYFEDPDGHNMEIITQPYGDNPAG
jgi:catechol 2,3-dioxygenase-like lactoylglutathione lyase family enzyme